MKIRRKHLPLLWFMFLGISSTFFLNLRDQDRMVNPDASLKRLEEGGKLLVLADWNVDLIECKGATDCSLVDSRLGLQIPSREAFNWAQSVKASYAIFSRYLTAEEIDWAKSHKRLLLVIPNPLSHRTKLMEPRRKEQVGQRIDALFEIQAREFEASLIKVQMDIRNFPYFGTSDLPIALSTLESARIYTQIGAQRQSEALLSRQIDIGLPAVLAAFAIILDHSLPFGSLSAFGVLKGIRTYLFTQWDQEIHAFMVGVLNFLYLPMLLLTVVLILGQLFNRTLCLVSLMASLLIQFIIIRGFSPYAIYCDLITDFSASILCLIFILQFLIRIIITKQLNREHVLLIPLLGFALLFSAFANATDFFLVEAGQSKDFSNWRHFMLLPMLAVASLVKIGSIVKTIKWHEVRAAEDASIKATMTEKLKLGSEAQKYLFDRQRTGEAYGIKFEFFHEFAGEMSGDWWHHYQSEKDGYHLFLGDVSGKGPPAALAVASVIATLEHARKAGLTMEDTLADLAWNIRKSFKGHLYTTIMCARIKEGKVDFWSIGSQRWLASDGRSFGVSQSPAGMADEFKFEHVSYEPGGKTIVGYTDGFFEGMREAKRLSRFISSETQVENEEIFDNAVAIGGHEKGRDDRTMLIIRGSDGGRLS